MHRGLEKLTLFIENGDCLLDVDKDEQAAKDVVEKSGDEGIPVIDVDGKIIKGFDKDALKAALGITED